MIASDKYWDATCIDCEGKLCNEEWFDAQSSLTDGPDSKLFNEYGDHRNTSYNHESHFFDIETCKEDTLDDVIDFFLT